MPTRSGKGSPPQDAVRLVSSSPGRLERLRMRLGSTSVQGFYKGTLDMSRGFATALCLVLEPISVFLIKIGESSSPVVQSSE